MIRLFSSMLSRHDEKMRENPRKFLKKNLVLTVVVVMVIQAPTVFILDPRLFLVVLIWTTIFAFAWMFYNAILAKRYKEEQ